MLEVDRIFFHTTKGEASVSVLQKLGLHCSNHLVRRVEQGIASRIIFFENTCLELIWIEDEYAAKQQAVRTGIDTLSRVRWQHTGASPFGIGLRRKSETTKLMRHRRKHWADWMRPNISVNFADDNLANAEEPICFVIPDSVALKTWLDCSIETHQQLISHSLGVKKLTNVKITVTSDKELTNAVSLLLRYGVVAIERGTSPLLELTFDNGTRGEILDTRPILPILFKY